MIEERIWHWAEKYPGSMGEYRFLKKDEYPIRVQVHLNDRLIRPTIPEGYDAYFGVVPRVDGSPMDYTKWLWADFDNREDFLFMQMRDFLVPPSLVLDSGRGFHTYWELHDEMPGDLASTVMKGIARYHNGDHTHDMARIMRLDNTINYKNGVRSRIISANSAAYDWSAFLEYAEEGRDKPAIRTVFSRQVSQTEIPGWLNERLAEQLPRGCRSERDFSVICSLVKRGWELGDIIELAYQYPEGFGSKFIEKGRNGPEWMKRNVEKAIRTMR